MIDPLEVADVALQILAVAIEVEDRIADELPRAVEGRLPTAVRLDHLDGGVVWQVHLALTGAASGGHDRRVLDQHHRLFTRAFDDGGRERPLQLECLLVRDESGIDEIRFGAHERRVVDGDPDRAGAHAR